MNEPCVPFDEIAPDDLLKDLSQCNRRCRALPTLGKYHGQKEWIVTCLCSSVRHEDPLMALLQWNNFNPIKRITPSAKLAALRELNKRIREEEGRIADAKHGPS